MIIALSDGSLGLRMSGILPTLELRSRIKKVPFFIRPLVRRRAEAVGITHQMEVLDGGSTDARPMQVAGPGCAAGCISIPCRYVHTPSETVDARDVEGAVQLLVAVLSNSIDL